LDIGAGIGKCMVAMFNAGFDVYGMEPSIPFYEKSLQHMKIDQNKLQNCALEDYQCDDEYFDFITFGAVLEHLYHPSDSINRALKWLKPGGFIQIEVPSSAWLYCSNCSLSKPDATRSAVAIIHCKKVSGR